METRLRFKDRIGFFIRSLSLQGSWSFQDMQGMGFFYALSPWLQSVHGELSKSALRRNLGFFNANPFMATYLIGVVSKLEADGRPERVQSAKDALMGPLGATGDGLFWATLRPLAVVFGLCVALFSPFAGIIVMLVLFNAVSISTRWLLLAKGYQNADEPLGYIADRGDQAAISRFSQILAPLLGFLLGSAATRTGIPGSFIALYLIALVLCIRSKKVWPVVCVTLTLTLLLGMLGLRTQLPWFPLN
jgi:mannose/fructose/N-acetylgalactosamine-specific phosphotransferase system component IID